MLNSSLSSTLSSTPSSYIEVIFIPPETVPWFSPNPRPNYGCSLFLLAIFLDLVFRGKAAAIIIASAVILVFSAAAVAAAALFASFSAFVFAQTAASAFVRYPRRFLVGGSPLISGIGGSWADGRGLVG